MSTVRDKSGTGRPALYGRQTYLPVLQTGIRSICAEAEPLGLTPANLSHCDVGFGFGLM